MLTALNIKGTIIEARPSMLEFVDREKIDALTYFMRERGAVFRLGEKVAHVGYDDKQRVVASLESANRSTATGSSTASADRRTPTC
jgi:NAD(P) transhydrogenase